MVGKRGGLGGHAVSALSHPLLLAQLLSGPFATHGIVHSCGWLIVAAMFRGKVQGMKLLKSGVTLIVFLGLAACAPETKPAPTPAPAVEAAVEAPPSLLFMSAEQQAQIYPAIETVYPTDTIKHGAYVRPLPAAAAEINPSWDYGGKTWTVDDYMTANHVSGVLVLKDGKIALERYGLGRKPDQRWTSFSVAKSFTSTLVGIAIKDGKIKSLQEPITTYIPELKGSGYDGVTVGQLLTMSSGVRWAEDYGDPNSDVAKYAFAPEEKPGVSGIVTYMAKLPREVEPGTRFHYSTGETDLAGILLESAVGTSLSDYASRKLWQPIGMEQDGIWITGADGHERSGCCMSLTLRDYARFGQFMLEGGRAQGVELLPRNWVQEATTSRISIGPGQPGYGYFWWMLDDGGYAAIGIFGQAITIYPKERLVIVSNAAWPTAETDDLYAAQAAFISATRKAASIP